MTEKRQLYYHKCRAWLGLIFVSDNKDQCRFCGRKRWKKYALVKKQGPIQIVKDIFKELLKR